MWPSDLLSIVQIKKVKSGHQKDESWKGSKNAFQEFQNRKSSHNDHLVSFIWYCDLLFDSFSVEIAIPSSSSQAYPSPYVLRGHNPTIQI